MTNVTMNALFKKMQKDDKKEVLEFHILGSKIKYENDIIGMAGNIVVIHVNDIEFKAAFKSTQKDSKKMNLKFELMGNNDEKSAMIYEMSGSHIDLTLTPNQMALEDFNDHEGIEVKANQDGTIEVANGQLGMDDIQIEETALTEEDELPFGIKQEESPFATGEVENLPFEVKVEDLKNEDDLLE